MLKGIDISGYQRSLKLEDVDVDFVIIKATEGVGFVDEYCNTFYNEAKRLNKKIGLYHFARPELNNTPIEEADFFIENIKNYIKEAILVLDWEVGRVGDTQWAKEFLDRVYEKTGVRALIYMNESTMRSYNWESVSKDYCLWIANYGINDGEANQDVFKEYPLKYWDRYVLWQYTSMGRLKGYDQFLDLDYFNGNRETWDKYARGEKVEIIDKPTKPDKPEKTDEELAREVIKGKFGNGKERMKKLGKRYKKVQELVNKLLRRNITYTVKKGDSVFMANNE